MREGLLFIGILAGIAAITFLLGRFVDKVTVPWRAKRNHEKFLRDFRAGKIKPVTYEQTLIPDNEGFAIRDDKTSLLRGQTLWRQVVKVTAYKRDLFSTDLICLFFHLTGETGTEVDEETNGWMAFIESLPKHLPGCQPPGGWYSAVMLPAFATNQTVIFALDGSPSGKGETT